MRDLGLTPRQRHILRRARAKRLRGAERWQVIPPLWVIAGTTLAPLLLILHPGRYGLSPTKWWKFPGSSAPA